MSAHINDFKYFAQSNFLIKGEETVSLLLIPFLRDFFYSFITLTLMATPKDTKKNILMKQFLDTLMGSLNRLLMITSIKLFMK